MASASEIGLEKKKRIFRKVDKDFVLFDSESMKTPLNIYSKPSYVSKFKGSYKSDEYSSPNWDKRNNRRQNGETGEYRYGGKPWHYNESSKEKYGNDAGRPPGNDTSVENLNVITPVILAREKSNKESEDLVESSSSSIKEPEVQKIEADPPTPTVSHRYQIASKPNVLEATVIAELKMVTSMKLLDDSLLLGEDFSPYLLDQGQFLVVAVVGLQGSGKSTIASLLADPWKGFKYKAEDCLIFRPESREELMSGCHTTTGVDAFITKDRVIILDLQPLLSPSVMDFIVMQERKASMDYSSTENLLEVESLQLLTFAMSVAHVLVVVQDYILHPNLIRLLHTCQMMKPTHSSSSSASNSNRDGANRGAYETPEQQQFFPHVVFVHNRAFSHHFRPTFVHELQSLYQLALSDSDLCLESQVGISSGTFSVPLNSKTTKFNINVFLIPDANYDHQCSVSFQDSILEMRRQIFSLARCPLTHVSLTEKSWYQFTCRMWENIRKSNLYVEYSRHLP